MPEIKIINDLPEGLLTSLEGSSIADFITHEACRTYFSLYKKNVIPSSFIQFIFNEYKNYTQLANSDIKKFFSFYKNEDIPMIIVNYQRDKFSVIKDKKEKTNETYYVIDTKKYIDMNFADNGVYGFTNPDLYSALNNIRDHIINSDELLSIKALYEKYMMREFLIEESQVRKRRYAFGAKSSAIATKANATLIDENNRLVGKAVEMPDQKGKVTKVFFPKLTLPTAYPTTQTKNRITKKVYIKKLMRADDQIKLINTKRINGVKYTQKFIDKRKELVKPEKKKFQFDF